MSAQQVWIFAVEIFLAGAVVSGLMVYMFMRHHVNYDVRGARRVLVIGSVALAGVVVYHAVLRHWAPEQYYLDGVQFVMFLLALGVISYCVDQAQEAKTRMGLHCGRR